MRCRFFVLFFPSHLCSSPLFFLSLLVVTQIRRHTSRLLSPPDGGPYLRNDHVRYEGRAQIVQTNSNESVRNTAQNGRQHGKWSEATPEIGICLALTVVRIPKGYNVWAVLSWLLLCYAYADGSQFKVSSSPLKNHKCRPRGPVRPMSMRGALCWLLPRYMRFCEGWKRLNFWTRKK